MTVIAGSDRQSGSPVRSGMTASQAGDDRIEMFKTDYIMEMMKRFFGIALIAITGIVAASCNGHHEGEEILNTGAYVLNNGAWGENNATISRYDPTTKAVSPRAFQTANGAGLGDLGQDIITLGKKMFIAVNGSKTIFVTDRDLTILSTITATADGNQLSPRYLCSGGGKVYVTYYEGYLGEIDPETYSVRTTAIGPNPDGLVYYDGKIYTANSGGYLYPAYNNTVSVVDAASFNETSTITVNVNPSGMALVEKTIFVYSFGNYADVQPKVQKIDPATSKVTDLSYASPSGIAVCDSYLYVLCGGYDENWNPLPGTVYKYDVAAGKDLGNFVTDGTTMPNAYSISYTKGHLWVGCSDYKTNGDVYLFDVYTGKQIDKFDSQGINPIKVVE